ncbi:MAG: ABC transporter permease [Clostridiales bacterium]|nr:ABC transporter permease [Clostridiales bacterium]
METLINLFNAAVLAGTPLLFGTLGEILTEKSGNLNLGVEGMMFMGAISGLAGVYVAESAFPNMGGAMIIIIAIICAFICGALGASIYSFLTVTMRANQNVTGLTLTIFGVGFANFCGEALAHTTSDGYVAVSPAAKAAFGNISLPGLSQIPYLGKLLFSYNILVYFSIVLAVLMALFFSHTRWGLNLRAVGENPATADAASINVSRYKHLATCIGGGICGIGGMYVSMITCSGVWVHNCVGGLGWISVALVIFATWSPARALLGSLVFGSLSIMRMYVPLGIPMQIYDIFPYIATVLVLIFTSIRQLKEHSMPRHCGFNYFREER